MQTKPKPEVRISCLPLQTEEEYQLLHRAVVAAMIQADIGVKSEDDMILLLPPDLMKKGLGQEVAIKYDLGNHEIGQGRRMIVNELVCTAVKCRYPLAHVQGRVNPPEAEYAHSYCVLP